MNKPVKRMSLNRDRNFAEQSTYFHSDTAVADVNMEVQGCFIGGLYMTTDQTNTNKKLLLGLQTDSDKSQNYSSYI